MAIFIYTYYTQHFTIHIIFMHYTVSAQISDEISNYELITYISAYYIH